LIFEGEYLRGEKHGSGKEYDKYGELIFEGEYIYNQKYKGKECCNGKLEFEGEYLFDRKFSGKFYDNKGNIIYELNQGNGIIKEYYNDYGGLIFEGVYLNGVRNGIGKEYYSECFDGYKLKFKGEFKKGKKCNGNGYKDGNIIYILSNGKGLMKEYVYDDILIYEGEYLNGKRNGKGKEFIPNNRSSLYPRCLLKFEGEYVNEKRNGKGKEYRYAQTCINFRQILNCFICIIFSLPSFLIN